MKNILKRFIAVALLSMLTFGAVIAQDVKVVEVTNSYAKTHFDAVYTASYSGKIAKGDVLKQKHYVSGNRTYTVIKAVYRKNTLLSSTTTDYTPEKSGVINIALENKSNKKLNYVIVVMLHSK